MSDRQSGLVRVDAHGMSTKDLLTRALEIFRAGNRMTFLCRAGESTAQIQRIRMRLSRLRAQMQRKNKPMQYFTLEARACPYTNTLGQRLECIILEQKKSQSDLIAEQLQKDVNHAESVGNAGQEVATQAGLQW